MKREYHIPTGNYMFVEPTLENVNRCAAQVSPFYVGSQKYFRQCSRKRGYGPNGELCVQHARLAHNGKAEP